MKLRIKKGLKENYLCFFFKQIQFGSNITFFNSAFRCFSKNCNGILPTVLRGFPLNYHQ